MWATGAKEESLNFLRQFSASLSRDLQQESEQNHRSVVSKHKLGELSKLLARCYFKQGEWQVALKDDWSSVCILIYCRSIYYHTIYREISRISCTLTS